MPRYRLRPGCKHFLRGGGHGLFLHRGDDPETRDITLTTEAANRIADKLIPLEDDGPKKPMNVVAPPSGTAPKKAPAPEPEPEEDAAADADEAEEEEETPTHKLVHVGGGRYNVINTESGDPINENYLSREEAQALVNSTKTD